MNIRPGASINGGLIRPPLILGHGWVITYRINYRCNYLSNFWSYLVYVIRLYHIVLHWKKNSCFLRNLKPHPISAICKYSVNNDGKKNKNDNGYDVIILVLLRQKTHAVRCGIDCVCNVSFCVCFISKELWDKWSRVRGSLCIFYYFVYHDNVIKCKHFPRNWPFVRGIHRGEFPTQRPVTRIFDVFLSASE